MKYIVLFFFCVQFFYAQTDTINDAKLKHDEYVKQLRIDDKTKIRNLMKLSDFRRIHKSKGVKINLDTIGYMISRKDTLVFFNESDDKNIIRVARPFEYRDSTFISLYKKIAFNEAVKDKVNKTVSLKYWKSEIKIYFTNSFPKKSRQSLLNFAESISNGIDSLRITEVKDIKNSNYVIYQENDYNYCDGLKNSKTDFYISWNGSNIIEKGFIKISSEEYFNEQLYNLKLNELFLKSLGFFKFTNAIDCENYFSNCFSVNKKFSDVDKELLKYHYSYGICKGVSEETFDEIQQKAIETKKISKMPGSYSIIHLVERKKIKQN